MRILIVDDEPMMLDMAEDVIKEVKPEAEIYSSLNSQEAYASAKQHAYDVAFLDVEMPGMNGIELAKKLKECNEAVNIIFVTAYAEYATEAFSIYASGYLMKPLEKEAVEKAFENLRFPITKSKKLLRIKCFGNFEVFCKDVPVVFGRSKAKEVFAYLIDRNGAGVNTAELCAVLWEDSVEQAKNRHYLRNLISDLKKSLRDCGAEEVFVSSRNLFAIDPDKLDCDYYRYLEHDPEAVKAYHGEYMKQFSWAEKRMQNN